MSNNGDGSKNVNGGGQPINTEKAPQEKTTETKVFDMLENVFSITLQGFFAGSIMGLCIENEPRKVENIEHISIASPVQYEEIAVSIAKKGAHCAMTVGVIACTIEAMDIVRGKKDPPLHYFTGGIIGGFLAGGMVSLVDKHCSHTPFRFRPVFAVKSSVVFGLAGLGMGLAANFMEKRTYMYEKNRSKTGGAGTSGNPIYDMLFPPKEEK